MSFKSTNYNKPIVHQPIKNQNFVHNFNTQKAKNVQVTYNPKISK